MHRILAVFLTLSLVPVLLAEDDSTAATPATSPEAASDLLRALETELPDDHEFFEGAPELSEDDTVAALEGLDGELGIPEAGVSDEDMAQLAEELGHELWVEDRDLYDRIFARYARAAIPLDADQTYYHRIVMERFGRVASPHREEISNLARFYVFLAREHEGMSFAGAQRYEPYGRAYSAGMGSGGYIPGVLDQFSTTLASLASARGATRYRTRTEDTGYYRHIFGVKLWDITREVPDPALGLVPNRSYAAFLGRFLAARRPGNGVRGIRETDLLLCWMIWKYPQDMLSDEVRGWAGSSWPAELGGAARAAEDTFVSKTTPSLAYNNEVARKLAEPVSWEALGMPSTGFYDRLARFSYEHPVLVDFIPVYGACWRAGNALLDCWEGRDAQGNQLGAGGRALAAGSFLFNYVLAVSDVYLVKGLAQVTVRGAQAGLSAAGRAAPAALQEGVAAGRAVTQRTFARMVQGVASRMPAGAGRTARALKDVMARQLKMIRNATVAPPAALVDKARAAAQGTFREMRAALRSVEKQIARSLGPGEEAYNLRSVSAAVDRVTGKVYTGINANGAVRGAVGAGGQTATHPRLAFLKRWLERVTGRRSLKKWDFENCAEWEAVNNALQDGARAEDLVVYTVKNASGKPFPCCLNCRLTTLGTAVASNQEAWAGQALAGGSAVGLTGQAVTNLTGSRRPQ